MMKKGGVAERKAHVERRSMRRSSLNSRAEEVSFMIGSRKGTQGFTLLELLMVVVMIAILAAIALPQYIKSAEKARATEAIQILGAIRSAESRYKGTSSANKYTNVIGDLDIETPTSYRDWNASTLKVTSTDLTTKGYASIKRSAGQYSGQELGMTFGTGRLCGDFAPMAPVNACADVED
jgi:prepilin-type N-terminal cleavage/methylation domain-containing protein